MEQTQRKSCAKCGKPVILTAHGFVHEGGGAYEQHCKDCGFQGGQVGGYQQCPRCGGSTALVDDHGAI